MPITSTLVDFRELAIAEEGRVALGVSEIVDESRPFLGGVAPRGEPGAWFNTVYAAGLAGPVERDEVRAMAAWYEEIGAEPRLDICPFVHETLLSALAAERFVLRRFETVLYRPLDPRERVESIFPAPPELRIEAVDPNDAGAVDSFARTAISGFLPEGMSPPESLLDSSRRVASHSRSTAIRAMIGEECVGAGAMEVAGDIAALFGVSVVPAHRRKGVQAAIVAWRLHRAAQAGAKNATISSLAGGPTERNAQRAGFRVAYTKVTLVRPGPGLTPAFE